MALPQYDVNSLIENVKRRASVPISQITLTPEAITRLADDELHGIVVPMMMGAREEFFVKYVDIPTPADKRIPMPEKTVGMKIRSICYVQQQTNPPILINIPRLDLDVVAGVGFSNTSTLAGFIIEGNDLVLYPPTSVPTGTNIRIYYYERTLVLADPDNYGRIVSIDENTNTVLLSTVPRDWVAGTKLNSVSQTVPFDVKSENIEITAVSSPSIVVDSVEGLAVGDYISEEGFSGVPQIPIEAHAFLAQLTTVKALEALGDRSGMEAAERKLEKMEKNLMNLFSQRVDGSVKKVMSPNGGLRLRSGLGRWGRGSGGGYGYF